MKRWLRKFFSAAARKNRITTIAGIAGVAAPILFACGQPQYAAIATAVSGALVGIYAKDAANDKP
jgi:hypothetical protein